MQRTRRFLSVVSLLVAFGAGPATAQVNPGWSYEILQNGAKVGEIFVPRHSRKADVYMEHWVLYSDYVYPSSAAPMDTLIVANKALYRDSTEFMAAEFPAGARYVDVTAHESTSLPCNTGTDLPAEAGKR